VTEEAPMSLAESAVSVMLPITEPARAQKFYNELLELPFDGNDGEGGLMFRLGGGTELVLRPLPAGQQSANTAMSFQVGDLPAEIARLEERGVHFEDYDLPGFTTVDHMVDSGGEKAAWFLDPDGNILCVHEARAPK
jgi:catechol 2,3-dioxygenase-like lactoylglutathione lyase family enzyme